MAAYLSSTHEYTELVKHHKEILSKDVHMRALFEEDPKRFEKYRLVFCNIILRLIWIVIEVYLYEGKVQ